MIVYLLWGLLWTFIIDYLTRNSPQELTNWERIMMVLVWPLIFVLLVWEIIKAFVNNE
jgi:membrane protein DedA with SNARE-associated domain